MTPPIDIIRIEGRSPEGDGVSRPFRCIDALGRVLYVKHKNVGYEHLVKEWISGRLAQELALKCADIAQVRLPHELVAGNREYETDLGHGIGFGSLRIHPAIPLSMGHLRAETDPDLAGILIFDWWVRNSDRALGTAGGNPNLLWQTDTREVVMIDHDNAFDFSFQPSDFWQFHALRSQTLAWDPGQRTDVSAWLARALEKLPIFWSELPEEWLTDPYGDPRLTFGMQDLRNVLSLPFDDPGAFWSPPQSY